MESQALHSPGITRMEQGVIKDMDVSLALTATCWLWNCGGPSSWLSRPPVPHRTLLCAWQHWPIWPTFVSFLALKLLVNLSLREAVTRGDMGGEWGKVLQFLPFWLACPPIHTLD